MDARLDFIMDEIKRVDNSFKEKENFFTALKGGIRYSQPEVRDIWFQGIRVGIEEGLHRGSLAGQRIQITQNTKDQRHKKFYDEFLKLANEYNCQIQYHPQHGMCVIDLKKQI